MWCTLFIIFEVLIMLFKKTSVNTSMSPIYTKCSFLNLPNMMLCCPYTFIKVLNCQILIWLVLLVIAFLTNRKIYRQMGFTCLWNEDKTFTDFSNSLHSIAFSIDKRIQHHSNNFFRYCLAHRLFYWSKERNKKPSLFFSRFICFHAIIQHVHHLPAFFGFWLAVNKEGIHKKLRARIRIVIYPFNIHLFNINIPVNKIKFAINLADFFYPANYSDFSIEKEILRNFRA